jgi:hypothetical protein
VVHYGGGSGPDGARREMLAADADRERTVETLNAAFSEGRLTPGEHEERVGRAYAARTYGELAALVADVPSGPALPQPSTTYQPYQPYPVYPLPAPYAPVRHSSGAAVGSLLTGLLGLFPLFVPSVAAVVLGHVARAQARRDGVPPEGSATAGLVLGYVMSCIWGLLFLGAFF